MNYLWVYSSYLHSRKARLKWYKAKHQFLQDPNKGIWGMIVDDWWLRSQQGRVGFHHSLEIAYLENLSQPSESAFFFSSWFYTFPSLCFFLSFWLTNTSLISSCLFISFCHRSLTYEFTCSSRIFSSSEMLGSSHQTKLHQSGSCSWTAEPWVVSYKKEQPGSGQSPCLFWCWCELTTSGNLRCWKLLTQILHICLCTLL